MASFQPTPAIFDIDPDLKVKEELVGIHSTGPFTPQDSSARSYMASSHISQSLTLNHGEDKIIQTGLEKQLGENTFSIKFPEDSRIVKVIPRYRGLSSNSINKVVEYTIILEDLEHNRLDILNVPFFHSTHPYFGFKYDWKKDVIDTLSVGDIVNKGTILADSPTKSNNKNWGNGVNANIALISLPETTEDGAVISESLAKKLSYTVFETRVIEFGNDNFPLNIYGDENNYKPFPDIGEFVNEDSVIMVLRDYEERLSPALAGRYDVNEFNPLFDRAVYVRGPGEITKDGNIKGQVVDIKVYTNPKAKHDVYTGTTEGIDKYVNSLKMYYQDILDVYRQKLDEYYSIHKNYNLPLSSELHNVIKEAYAVVNPDNRKLGYTFRSDPMDLYRVEIKIMYTVVPGIGNKLSDAHGSKGVIVDIWPDEDMPVDITGRNRADLLMEPGSVISRMNPGRIYEHYVAGMSRRCKHMILEKYGEDFSKYTPAAIEDSFNIILGLLELIGTEQYTAYKAVKTLEDKAAIVQEAVEKEVYLYYKISSEKKPYQIVLDTIKAAASGTSYEPIVDKVKFRRLGKEYVTKEPVMISPQYTILLNKTAETYLSVAGARVNHFGFPISVGNTSKYRLPHRPNPVKTLSETETRLYTSYVSQRGILELKDRANSIKTHEALYKNILDAPMPTNIDSVVDRSKVPYGEDSALQLVNNIFNAAGLEMDWVPDRTIIHEPLKGEKS